MVAEGEGDCVGEVVSEVEEEVGLVLEAVVALWGRVVDVDVDFFVLLDDIAFLSATMGFSVLREIGLFASAALSDSLRKLSRSDPAFIAACLVVCFASRTSGPELEVFSNAWSLGSALGMPAWELFVSPGWTAGASFSDSGFRKTFDTLPFSAVIFPDMTGSSIAGTVSLASGCTIGWARWPGTMMPPLLLETDF